MSRYLDRLFSEAERATNRAKDRLADRVADRLADAVTRRSTAIVLSDQDYREYLATVEILENASALAALREADSQSDEDARSYDEIRRELGLA